MNDILDGLNKKFRFYFQVNTPEQEDEQATRRASRSKKYKSNLVHNDVWSSDMNGEDVTARGNAKCNILLE